MEPYIPILPYEILAQKLGRKPSEIVKLDANENPFGPSPKVKQALKDAPFLHIYPDPECVFLREELAKYTNVPMEHLLVGAGADELIDLLFRLFITPGKGQSVVNFPPTFGMYKFDSDVNGAKCVNLYRDEQFRLPIDQLEALYKGDGNDPRMIFIASPNNPDGSTVSDAELKRILKLPSLVVLDEAYFEFASDNRIGWVLEHSNLVVLRTFSKWAALAGMRVGYGAFPLAVIKHLWKIKQPYNVAVASQMAALVSLQDKQDLLAKVELMKKERTRFYQVITEFDWLHPYPSSSNYVLCRMVASKKDHGKKMRSALEIKDALAKRGILIRYYNSKGLEDCIRVSMGTPEQMNTLYDALREL